MSSKVQILQSSTPEISVVMSVYNRAEQLKQTVNSILSQEEVSLEFIIINDGSTDDSGKILDAYADFDDRVRVFHQENQGLTKALIRGCSEARGTYIARQDAGDVSLPGRLKKQLEKIKSNEDTALISCGSRFLGPSGEFLYEIIQDPETSEKILMSDFKTIKGASHHGSTFVARELYDKIGGYRSQFYYAQDIDLWVRLNEHGRHIPLSEVLYEASFSFESISGRCRNKQIALTNLIVQAAQMRRNKMDDAHILKKASQIRPDGSNNYRRTTASALYFVGACLQRQNNDSAKHYFVESIKVWPLQLKSWVRLICR